MKICLVSRAPFLGGAEVACERLATGLLRAGHDVRTILGQKGVVAERFRSHSVPCQIFPTPLRDKRHWLRYLSGCFRLRRFFKQFRPDVIHSNDLPTHQIVSSAARGLGIPRVCYHRFIYPQTALDWMNRAGAEHHCFVSQYLQKELQTTSSRLAGEPGSVLYDGLPLPTLPTAAENVEAKRLLEVSTERLLVLYAGQIVECKGVADLIEAWSRLPPEIVERAAFVLVGDDVQSQGAYRREMEQFAAMRGVTARFVGFRKDVPLWLTAADLVVVPSRIEPLGNATLEAMSYGLPIIGAATGGIPEMIVHEESGWLTPAAQPDALATKIEFALSNPDQRRQMGLAARQRCEALFSLERHTENALALYHRLVKCTDRV